MDKAVLNGSEIVGFSVVDGEINRETSGVNESHSTSHLLNYGIRVDVYLVGVFLAFKLLQIDEKNINRCL